MKKSTSALVDESLCVDNRVSSEVGARMKAAREALRLTQEGLAKAVGGSKRGIQENEARNRVPGGDVVAGMVRLGINANWLLTGSGEMLVSEAEAQRSVQSKSMVSQDVAPYSVNVSVDSQAMPEISSMVARCIVAAESITEGRLDRHQQVSFGLDVWGALQRLAGGADAAARLAGLTDADLEQLARLVMNIRRCSASK